MMSKAETPKSEIRAAEPLDLEIVEGELIEDSQTAAVTKKPPATITERKAKISVTERENRLFDEEQSRRSALLRTYLLLPLIFLSVTLLGGLRLDAETNDFIFLKPALVCLVFAAVLLILFFRARLLRLGGWFSESFTTLKNIADAFVLFTLFAASVQIFNSLLPEKGLPYWVMALLFFWTLWNNLFSVFTARRLLQSLGSLFGLAFVLKYLILAGLAAPATSDNWLRALLENPTQEVFTRLLDLPKFSAGTGYVQFFTVIFYLAGLFLLSPVAGESQRAPLPSTDSSETIS